MKIKEWEQNLEKEKQIQEDNEWYAETTERIDRIGRWFTPQARVILRFFVNAAKNSEIVYDMHYGKMVKNKYVEHSLAKEKKLLEKEEKKWLETETIKMFAKNKKKAVKKC